MKRRRNQKKNAVLWVVQNPWTGKDAVWTPKDAVWTLKDAVSFCFLPACASSQQKTPSLEKDAVTAFFPEKAIICAVSKIQVCTTDQDPSSAYKGLSTSPRYDPDLGLPYADQARGG